MSNQFFRTLDELIEERENQQKRLEDENARNGQEGKHESTRLDEYDIAVIRAIVIARYVKPGNPHQLLSTGGGSFV